MHDQFSAKKRSAKMKSIVMAFVGLFACLLAPAAQAGTSLNIDGHSCAPIGRSFPSLYGYTEEGLHMTWHGFNAVCPATGWSSPTSITTATVYYINRDTNPSHDVSCWIRGVVGAGLVPALPPGVNPLPTPGTARGTPDSIVITGTGIDSASYRDIYITCNGSDDFTIYGVSFFAP
jgi:hypothetical protein